tara:strand:+ start:95 stop:283 length:189 start_codon:yes stop_codon:yes gene_type:complete
MTTHLYFDFLGLLGIPIYTIREILGQKSFYKKQKIFRAQSAFEITSQYQCLFNLARPKTSKS